MERRLLAVLLVCILVCGVWTYRPCLAQPVNDQSLEQTVAKTQSELDLKFSDPNDPGLAERRKRLRQLFSSLPPRSAKEFRKRLGTTPTGHPLSQKFHSTLARETRNELLRVLDTLAATAQPHLPDTSAPEPTLLTTHAPLPISEAPRFRTVLQTLKGSAQNSTDPRVRRAKCWMEKLTREEADDRIVPWIKICPMTSGAMGAALVVGPCVIGRGSTVDQAALEAAIKDVRDVEPANEELRFIVHVKPEVVNNREFVAAEDLELEAFLALTNDGAVAVEKLDEWANAPLGGSSAMPPAYRAIKDWIGARQRDPRSGYSCL